MQYTNGSVFATTYARLYSPRMNLATRLDQAMKEARDYGPKGISQSELHRKSGVPQATISRTLKGDTSPETDTIRRLAAALNITFEWLNEGIQPKYRSDLRPQNEQSHIKLAANQDNEQPSPEEYAQLILLFGKASKTARKETLRALGKSVKADTDRKSGAGVD